MIDRGRGGGDGTFGHRENFVAATASARNGFVLLSERQVLVANGLVLAERARRALVTDVPFLEHVDAVGQRQREVHVLLGEQDREPLTLEPSDLLGEMLDDQRREPL